MGDLYKVATGGGRAVQLTSHPARDHKPLWSEDGKTLAFASDRYGNDDVFLITAEGGMPRRLTFHSAGDIPQAFTPDGRSLYFTSTRMDRRESSLYPTRYPELYRVGVMADRPVQVLTTPVERMNLSADGSFFLFEDLKAYEDEFRKHHTSSHARDIWSCKHGSLVFTKLTSHEAEDRNPVLDPDGETFYFLSERGGSMNVYRAPLEDAAGAEPLTSFVRHPVRSLSAAVNGTLCFSFDGELYTLQQGGEPEKVKVDIYTDRVSNDVTILPVSSGVSEMVVSPNGKEILFIFRGEVFATSVEGGMTRRITSTPEREKNLSIHPEGKAVVYASERDGSWSIFQSKLTNKEDKYFVTSSAFEEEPLVQTDRTCFQPAYSPDGKEVAFLEDRTSLKVINLESKAIREIHDGSRNWSYADGDQYFAWSPDSKWFFMEFYPDRYGFTEAGMVAADGKGKIRNMTRSGFSDSRPQWMDKGRMMLWFSDKTGLRSYANSGPAQVDAYAMFLTIDAWDKFRLSKEEYALMVGEDKDKEKNNEAKKEDGKKGGKKKDEKKKDGQQEDKEEKKVDPLKFDEEGMMDRVARLSLYSSYISDAKITPDGKKMLYFSRVEKGFDLWQIDLRTKENKVLAKFGKGPGSLHFDNEGKHVYVLSGGMITKVEMSSGKPKPVAIKGEMRLDEQAERACLYDHVRRQVSEKFLDTALHGTDWAGLCDDYEKFLPHINNNYDFAELLSELLGELNASHTGGRYRKSDPGGDQTASLGAFFDPEYTGDGLKITEILAGGPLVDTGKIRAGVILEKIDGDSIRAGKNYYPLLNRKAGQWSLLSFHDPSTGERWSRNTKLISSRDQGRLLYKRWIKTTRAKVHEFSDGRVGYVHIPGMADGPFRELIKEVLGEEVDKDALVVDTRWNGGGDLVEDLTNFLVGEVYEDILYYGKLVGHYSPNTWTKPSIVLVNEGNYSDGHCFPEAYRDREIGRTVGMPVAGTCSFVWWERMMNGVVFGIPNMGVTNKAGTILENHQFEPDLVVVNEYAEIPRGRDQQLERAVSEILLELEGEN
jgi:Tol biopolymer transport system component/C-terminal processing protease CtpA/Prc